MTDLRINVDATEAIGLMGRISDNFPTARTWALNRTAEDVTFALRQEASAALTFRGARGQAVLNWYAPKTLPGRLRATNARPYVTIDPEGPGKILRPFETGTPHTYDALGRPVAVPSFGAGGLRSNKATEIPAKLFPANLGLQPRRDPKGTTYFALGRNSIRNKLKPWRTFGSTTVKEGRMGTYEVPSRTHPGESLVFQRKTGRTVAGQAGNRGTLLWIMKPMVRRPRVLSTYATAQRIVAQRWQPNLLGAFRFIVRSPGGRGASLLDLTI